MGKPAQVGGPMTKKIKRGQSANWALAANKVSNAQKATFDADGKMKKAINPSQAMYIREVSKGKKPVKISR